MLVLNGSEVARALPMPDAIAAMKAAFLAISNRQVDLPTRTHFESPSRDGTTLVMPAQVLAPDQESLAVKVVSVFNQNPQQGLPRIQAIVTVIDPETGRPNALLDGTALTAIRTAAASAAATDVLARRDSRSLTVIGAGVQAQSHIEAMACVRSLKVVRLISRTRAACEALAERVRGRLPEACRIEIVEDADEAVRSADIVCTVSTASTPLFRPDALRPGAHLNAVGSYQPSVAEVPPTVVKDARVYVDHLESALAEAGDLIQPIRSGLIAADHIRGEIGQVLNGELQGRTSDAQITLFKSVGNAAEDCFAATAALRAARRLQLGTPIEL